MRRSLRRFGCVKGVVVFDNGAVTNGGGCMRLTGVAVATAGDERIITECIALLAAVLVVFSLVVGTITRLNDSSLVFFIGGNDSIVVDEKDEVGRINNEVLVVVVVDVGEFGKLKAAEFVLVLLLSVVVVVVSL